jgi:hypothetical protein
MLHDPARMEAALAPLVGLPLWKSHRAADLQVFQFGAKRTVTSNFGPRKGQGSEVGEYALHVQCSWRIRGPRGIVVASGDRYYRAGPDPLLKDDEGSDSSSPIATRCDERIYEWLDARAYDVERVSVDAIGSIALSLSEDFALDVFPDNSLDGEYGEHWRLLRPSDLTSHFVVGGDGIDAGNACGE